MHAQTDVGDLVYARRGDHWYPAYVVSKHANFVVLRWGDAEGGVLNGGHAKYGDLRTEDPRVA